MVLLAYLASKKGCFDNISQSTIPIGPDWVLALTLPHLSIGWKLEKFFFG
jgi:hypothetical protein